MASLIVALVVGAAQLVIATWFMVRVVWRLRALAKERKATSGIVALVFMGFLAIDVMIIAVLHVGGFW